MSSSAFKPSNGKPRNQRVRFDPSTPGPPRRTRPSTPHPDFGSRDDASPASPASPRVTAAASTKVPAQTQPAPLQTKTATTPAPTVPPVNTYTNPAFGVNPTFSHYTTTGPAPGSYSNCPQSFNGAFEASGFFPQHINGGFQAIPATGAVSQPLFFTYSNPTGFVQVNMADYQNATPPNAGVNFQPQVPDTTNGPFVSTYVPRQDPPGAVYPQPGQPVFQAVQGAIHLQGTQAVGIAPVTAPLVPVIQQQPPPMPQPMFLSGQPVMMGGGPMQCGQPAMVMGGQPQMGPGNCGYFPEPALGQGRTPGELSLEQAQFAYNNNLNEPHDIKPADDDPSRHYWVRELDGNYTMRSRISIDTMGDSRWYISDSGVFYAVRLPN